MGYSLAEILGEKYLGGERVWDGIRGGTREVGYCGSQEFAIGASLTVSTRKRKSTDRAGVQYSIRVGAIDVLDYVPTVAEETLATTEVAGFAVTETIGVRHVKVVFRREKGTKGRHVPSTSYISSTPVVAQVADDPELNCPFSARFRALGPARVAVVPVPRSFNKPDAHPVAARPDHIGRPRRESFLCPVRNMRRRIQKGGTP